MRPSPFVNNYLQEGYTMDQQKGYKEMTYEERVANYAAELETESDFCDVYNSWCVLLEELVLMPRYAFDNKQFGFEAVKSLFCKHSGISVDSSLVNLFYVFYLGWIHGIDFDRSIYHNPPAHHAEV